MKSIESIDKTAKSIGEFDSINYGVYMTLTFELIDLENVNQRAKYQHKRSFVISYSPDKRTRPISLPVSLVVNKIVRFTGNAVLGASVQSVSKPVRFSHSKSVGKI